MKNKGLWFMLISTIAFSLMQLCIKYLSHIPTLEVVLFRSVFSFLVTLSYLRYHRISPLGNNKKVLFLRGLFGSIALTCFVFTIQNIPLGTAVTVNYLSPLFTAIFAIYLLKEKMKWQQGIFFLIAISGIALLKGFDTRFSVGFLFLGIVGAMLAGLAYNCIRILRHTEHPWVVVLSFPVVAIPLTGIGTLFNWVTPVGNEWWIILLMGIFTQIGQVFMTMGLQSGAAGKMVSVKYLGSISALVFGYFLFDETYHLLSLIGILLVLFGVILNVTFKEKVVASS